MLEVAPTNASDSFSLRLRSRPKRDGEPRDLKKILEPALVHRTSKEQMPSDLHVEKAAKKKQHAAPEMEPAPSPKRQKLFESPGSKNTSTMDDEAVEACEILLGLWSQSPLLTFSTSARPLEPNDMEVDVPEVPKPKSRPTLKFSNRSHRPVLFKRNYGLNLS